MYPCPECAEDVSPEAAKCAACGANLLREEFEAREAPWPIGVEVGPAGALVVAGLLVGFALGSPLHGWRQAAVCVAFAGVGAGAWWLLGGPLARLRAGTNAGQPTATAIEGAEEVTPPPPGQESTHAEAPPAEAPTTIDTSAASADLGQTPSS